MKTIRISENVTTRTIETDEGESRRRDFDDIEAETTIDEDVPLKDEEIQRDEDNHWPNLYVYIVFLASVGTGAGVLSITVQVASIVSGGFFAVLMIVFSVFTVLPLMYLEMFIGIYSKKTNSEMYRMAPIFFGLGIVIFVLNGSYIVSQAIEDSTSLLSVFWRITNKGAKIINCPADHQSVCYNYRTRGPLNDTCVYGYYSLVCNRSGVIRYPFEYNYWHAFKNAHVHSREFPAWSLLASVCVLWVIIFITTTRSMSICAKLYVGFYVVKLLIFTAIYGLAYPLTGVGKTVKIKLQKLDLTQVLSLGIFSMHRMGMIIPMGYMTNSAHVEHSQYVTLEGVAVVFLGIVLTLSDLLVVQAIMGALSTAIGAGDPSSVGVPYRGLFLALIPEFLQYLDLSMEFVYPYYITYIGLQIVRVAIQVRLLILNFYGYFPKLRKNDDYVQLAFCAVFLIFSTATVFKDVHVTYLPDFYSVLLRVALIFCLAAQMTMISYVYGVRRVCDDIHFTTGHRPMQFWRLSWTIMPLVLWLTFAMMTRTRKTIIEAHPSNTVRAKGVYVLAIIILVLLVGAIAYIFHAMGTEHMLLNLIRPQFYWGPMKREDRMKRKHFTPTTAIRSQPPLIKSIKLKDKRDRREKANAKKSAARREEIRNEMLEHISTGRIYSDSKFFANVGISLDQTSLLNVRPDSRRKDASQRQLNLNVI